MYLAPSKGFKPSVCSNPAATFTYATMGEMEHGIVSYDLNAQTAWYRPAEGKAEFKIVLVPGKDDTIESWFKIGGADVMADKFIANKKLPPFSIVVDCHRCDKRAEKRCEKEEMCGGKKAYVLKADGIVGSIPTETLFAEIHNMNLFVLLMSDGERIEAAVNNGENSGNEAAGIAD